MPALEAAQQAQLTAVCASLRRHIAERGGWIGFNDYLEQVLYAPGLGYYSAGAAKFGAAGDFVTAPEVSPLFAACVARQCAPILREGGELLELGAGSGALAAVLLPRLAAADALPTRYSILEVSADLRERQRARLSALSPELHACIQWRDALPAQPLRGVILANEVADALPFQRFEVRADGYQECGVSIGGEGQPVWASRAASAPLRAELTRIAGELTQPLEPGYRSEVCMRLAPWIAELASRLDAGYLLLFDYGLGRQEFYHPQRSDGTLRCHYRHRAHADPFLYPGLQDISAWVDFTRVAEAAVGAGLDVSGYCTQAAFLLGAGIDAELASGSTPLDRARAASEARILLMPGEMGEAFKAMWLTRGSVPDSAAFGVQDLRRLL